MASPRELPLVGEQQAETSALGVWLGSVFMNTLPERDQASHATIKSPVEFNNELNSMELRLRNKRKLTTQEECKFLGNTSYIATHSSARQTQIERAQALRKQIEASTRNSNVLFGWFVVGTIMMVFTFAYQVYSSVKSHKF